MADFLYQTSLDHGGPWLLDAKTLEELDVVIDGVWERVQAAAEREFSLTVERRLDDIGYKEHERRDDKRQAMMAELRSDQCARTLTVSCRSGMKVNSTKLSEVLKDHRMTNERPDAVAVRLRGGSIRCTVEVNKRGLAVSVEPRSDAAAGDIFSALSDWVRRHQPPSWQQFWRRNVGLHFVIYAGLAFVLIAIAQATSGAPTVRQEARELLAKGIGPAEQVKALELTLSIVSQYDTTQKVNPQWLWPTLLMGLVLTIILSFPPPGATLGFGKGKGL